MIHSFTRFKSFINEDFIDALSGKKEEGEEKKKEDKTANAGVQDASLDEFYKTLQDFADSKEAIEVQTYGNMKYSKIVENIQLALSFLGYPFQKYGVDGFFGPETANAILKFNEDTVPKTKDDAHGAETKS
jgi:peptidoglycan hydrolase-like protein with peptidoglycan-binding domain